MGCSVCRGLGPASTSDPGSGVFEVGCGRWRQEESHPAAPKAEPCSVGKKGPGGPSRQEGLSGVGGASSDP